MSIATVITVMCWNGALHVIGTNNIYYVTLSINSQL